MTVESNASFKSRSNNRCMFAIQSIKLNDFYPMITESNVNNQKNENSRLKSTVENNRSSIMKMNEDWHFDYWLGSDMATNKREIVKFDRKESESANRPYNPSTGKVVIREPGVYFFTASAFPNS